MLSALRVVDEHDHFDEHLILGNHRSSAIQRKPEVGDLRIDRSTQIKDITASTKPETVGTEEQDLKAAVAAAVHDTARGGLLAYILTGGELSTAEAGNRNETGDPISPDDQFSIASVSKVYTAVLTHKSAEEGQIDIDAPLNTYLPAFDYDATITIDSLLRHLSGIPDYIPGSYTTDAFNNVNRVFTQEELLEYSSKLPHSPPNQKYEYSNTNYVLLAMVMEEVTGKSMDEALKEHITGPLELDSTSYIDPTKPREALVSGFMPGPTMPVSALFSGIAGDGGIIANAADLHTFLAALFDGQLISAESLEDMTSRESHTGVKTPWYGQGIEIDEKAGTFGHSGSNPGYMSHAMIKPETGDIAIFLFNDPTLEKSAPILIEEYGLGF